MNDECKAELRRFISKWAPAKCSLRGREFMEDVAALVLAAMDSGSESTAKAIQSVLADKAR